MNDQTLIKQKILNFLKQQRLAVISTIHTNGEGPESAVVAFAENDALEIVFGTSNTSRKYNNIQKNKKVSLVIGWDSNVGTVQYEGEANELSKTESTVYANVQIEKNPDSKKFVDRSDQRYFLIKPKWIRLVDNVGPPPDTYEITFV